MYIIIGFVMRLARPILSLHSNAIGRRNLINYCSRNNGREGGRQQKKTDHIITKKLEQKNWTNRIDIKIKQQIFFNSSFAAAPSSSVHSLSYTCEKVEGGF